MANPELGGVNRTIDDSNAVVNSGSVANRHDPEVSSDTEQYVGIDQASQRPGSKKKACFQITKVSKRNEAENDANNDDADSNDELDESRTGGDEFSSSELIDVNISRNSISELDPAGDDGGNPVAVVPTRLGSVSAEEQPNVNSVTTNANQANGNGPHRFKVVKVATDPIRKGRWTCRDFPSETTKTQSTPEGIRNQDIMSKETHSGNSSAASSVHYVHGQDNNADNPLTQIDDNDKKVDLNRKISSTSSKDVTNLNDDDDEREDRPDLKQQLKGGLQEPESTDGDDGTSPAGGAIDNKIEQAMDLVKSHLLFAVREEVEVLKEQIKILLEKNEKLQEENSALKQRLQTGGAPPPQQPPHQGMPLQPPTQDPSPYPTMPNQLGQGLGQTPMGQTLSDHAAYPQHQRPTQQTHSAPNPGGLADANPQYTPQTSVESQGQYHSAHSQRHLPDMPQYSQVAATPAPQQQPPQTAPQAGQQGQASYHAAMASANRSNTTH